MPTPDELRHLLTHEPDIVTTTLGDMPKEQLVREVIEFEDDNELTYAIEYRLKTDNGALGEIVKRSVHIQLKRNVTSEGVAAMMG